MRLRSDSRPSGEPLVELARSADQLAVAVMRHLDAVERAVERGVGKLVVAVPEGGFPGDVERLALEPVAQPVRGFAAHPDAARRRADRVRGGKLAQEIGHLGLVPPVAAPDVDGRRRCGRPRWVGGGLRRGSRPLRSLAGQRHRLDGAPVLVHPRDDDFVGRGLSVRARQPAEGGVGRIGKRRRLRGRGLSILPGTGRGTIGTMVVGGSPRTAAPEGETPTTALRAVRLPS